VIAQRKNGSLFEALLTLGELFDNGTKLLMAVFSSVAETRASISNLVHDSGDYSDDTFSDDTLSDGSVLSRSPSLNDGLSRSPSTNDSFLCRSPSRFSQSQDTVARVSRGTPSLPAEYRKAIRVVQSGVEAMLTREFSQLHERAASAATENVAGRLASSTMPKGVEQGDVIIERRISRGGGSGCAVFSVTVQGWRCAMKELDISRTNQREVESFLKEISVCEGLPYHPNICRYLFHDRAGDRLRLFMTQYEGTLFDHILKLKDSGRSFSLRELVRLAQELLQGIAFLHKNKLLHRDLKSENVFVIMNDRNEVHSLAVGDFDQAKKTTQAAMTVVGTPGYTAPEVLSGSAYSYPADVWSFGMVLYEMAALQRPFEGLGMLQLSKAVAEGAPVFPESFECPALREVYMACTVKDPARRATVGQLQQMLSVVAYS
jgi:NIMA (never in mitosis gene a)-related kinase